MCIESDIYRLLARYFGAQLYISSLNSFLRFCFDNSISDSVFQGYQKSQEKTTQLYIYKLALSTRGEVAINFLFRLHVLWCCYLLVTIEIFDSFFPCLGLV